MHMRCTRSDAIQPCNALKKHVEILWKHSPVPACM